MVCALCSVTRPSTPVPSESLPPPDSANQLPANDVYEGLKVKGYAHVLMSSPPAKSNRLDLLWGGIEGVLANERGRSRQAGERLLQECALAPGLDGQVWRCRSAYRADKRTRELFAPWISDGVTFLTEEGVPLLERLCSAFTADVAIEMLGFAELGQLEDGWKSGNYDPVAMLCWFEERRSGLTAELRAELATLSIFPSVRNLHPLKELWLPGGFQDPLDEASILDSGLPDSLSNFIQDLGIKQLSFEDYAIRYIARAFERGSTVDPGTKRKLLATLEKHIGEIRDKSQVRSALAAAWIVECEDGVFRQPGTVYLPTEEVKGVLGDHVSYARLPDGSEPRSDLYRWLGVRSRPRITDVLRVIDQATTTKPNQEARSVVVKMLGVLGQRWGELGASDEASCRSLKVKAWLPAEADANTWYRPDEIFAAYNKDLFASQGKFLDFPVRDQQNIGAFLRWLGVGLSPRSIQVVRHLLRFADLDAEPPSNIYRWLNDNANPGELREMRGKACLRVSKGYLRPDQVFWGSHPFGRFRVQLGSALRSYQDLLEALDVREKPDFSDAIEVLKDIAEEIGSGALELEDKDVVIRCWIMMSDALESGGLNAELLRTKLGDTQCIPTNQGYLHRPSWMFFEDRPGLADKFPGQLDQNCIPRTGGAWLAMKAAGVRLVSDVVRGYVSECVNRLEDDEMAEQVTSRARLIRTILEGVTDQSEGRTSILDHIRFVRGDELLVNWSLRAFDREWRDTSPKAASAHWDSEEQVVYFANLGNGTPPWSAIARELTLALAPGANPASISPGLKSILEARTASDAGEQLSELGIASVNVLNEEPVEAMVADTLGSEISGARWENSFGGANNNNPGVDLAADGSGDPEDWFAQHLHGVQTTTPSSAPDNPVLLPVGGPNTPWSATNYTIRAGRVGRTEGHELSLVTRSELGPRGRALADEFRDMVQGDYGKRCQICSRTFVRQGGGWLVNVVHVVPPRTDHRTNHFGDLLGLCGWHFNLFRYGEWALLDPNTNLAFEDLNGKRGWERMRSFIRDRVADADELGNSYVGLPVRFSNVYHNWQSEPIVLNEEIRYSIPHWTFLCELLTV